MIEDGSVQGFSRGIEGKRAGKWDGRLGNRCAAKSLAPTRLSLTCSYEYLASQHLSRFVPLDYEGDTGSGAYVGHTSVVRRRSATRHPRCACWLTLAGQRASAFGVARRRVAHHPGYADHRPTTYSGGAAHVRRVSPSRTAPLTYARTASLRPRAARLSCVLDLHARPLLPVCLSSLRQSLSLTFSVPHSRVMQVLPPDIISIRTDNKFPNLLDDSSDAVSCVSPRKHKKPKGFDGEVAEANVEQMMGLMPLKVIHGASLRRFSRPFIPPSA